MQPFANLRDGGSQLADHLAAQYAMGAATLVPIMPNGVPVALGIVDSLRSRTLDRIPIEPMDVIRDKDGISIAAIPQLHGDPLIVVDDGVETGTAALAAGRALRGALQAQPAGTSPILLLAVPVCPHQALPELLGVFDAVVAVHRPLARRSLSWHYVDFDLVDDAGARELLRQAPWD